MDFDSKNLQKQYEGYLHTKQLWKGNLNGLFQIEIPPQNSSRFHKMIAENIRLGKRVERFVSNRLEQDHAVKILLENQQIQRNKITIGELDCLYTQEDQCIHLEIVYKFYLYNARIGTSEIEHWIGPNKKDSLAQKLHKLKEKQLPLLYKDETKEHLAFHNLTVDKIEQKIEFRAQLFVPYTEESYTFKAINSDCVTGFYITFNELTQFKNCKFYIPSKLNWLLVPHQNVSWLPHEVFLEKASNYMVQKTAPLCWLKQQNGTIVKFFLIWWT